MPLGPAQAIAIKIAGQVASATIAERDWKCYKNMVSKKRTGLGLERKGGSGSSGVRLTNVRANMHLDEFDDKDAHEEECFLRSFDIDEESKFAQMFFVAQNRHVIDALAKKPFLYFLEDWEDPSGKALSDMKNRVAQFKLVRSSSSWRSTTACSCTTPTTTSTARSPTSSGPIARATRS